jgi:hypothetical protein
VVGLFDFLAMQRIRGPALELGISRDQINFAGRAGRLKRAVLGRIRTDQVLSICSAFIGAAMRGCEINSLLSLMANGMFDA